MRKRIVAVLCARNEEKVIAATLFSLSRQTHYVSKIVVVNDGSTDNTHYIAEKLGCRVVDAPFHEESYVGKPKLAEVWNRGLREAAWYKPDYILLLGADHPLPPTYVEDLLSKIKEDGKIWVSSGRIEGEGFKRSQPRGSGRIVRFNFWKWISKVQYPVAYGWESWLIYSCLDQGGTAVCFKDVSAGSLMRKTGSSLAKSFALGKGMYALGYYWVYALGRCVKLFPKSPRSAVSMLKGWLSREDVERLDVVSYVEMRDIVAVYTC